MLTRECPPPPPYIQSQIMFFGDASPYIRRYTATNEMKHSPKYQMENKELAYQISPDYRLTFGMNTTSCVEVAPMINIADIIPYTIPICSCSDRFSVTPTALRTMTLYRQAPIRRESFSAGILTCKIHTHKIACITRSKILFVCLN